MINSGIAYFRDFSKDAFNDISQHSIRDSSRDFFIDFPRDSFTGISLDICFSGYSADSIRGFSRILAASQDSLLGASWDSIIFSGFTYEIPSKTHAGFLLRFFPGLFKKC